MIPVDTLSQDGNEYGNYDDDGDEEYESMTVTDAGDDYDEKMDYKAEMDALEKLQGKEKKYFRSIYG